MTSPSSVAAFDALAIVIRDRGIDIADDPSRLRGMLNDVLAADARVNRAAVDALVLAAEQGVPRELSSTPVPDEARLVARLTGRGVDPALAGQTVRAWIVAAQGGRTAPAPAAPTVPPPDALPPPPPPPTVRPASPPAPLGATIVPAAGATVVPPNTGDTFESTSPSALDPADVPTGASPALEPVLVPPPPPSPASGASGDGRVPRRLVLVLVGAVVAAVALIAAFLTLGGDDDDAASPTTVAPSTTTSTTTTLPGEPLLEVLAPAAGTEATTTSAELSGRVDPGSSVTVDGTAVTVDAAGNWKQSVSLPAAENSFAIVVTTPTGSTKTVSWVVKRDAVAPALEITDPVDGAVLGTREVLLHGTTERNATVVVDGVGAAPDTGATTDTVLAWVSGVLIDGDQKTFTITSTDPAGNVTTKTVTLRYQGSAPPPPSTTPRPKPPTGGPPVVTTTTPAPPPPPAVTLVANNDSGGSYNYSELGEFGVNVLGNDTYAGYTDIEFSGLNPGYGSIRRGSGGFFIYTMRQNGTYTETFQYRLRNAGTGEVSNWATVTIDIIAS